MAHGWRLKYDPTVNKIRIIFHPLGAQNFEPLFRGQHRFAKIRLALGGASGGRREFGGVAVYDCGRFAHVGGWESRRHKAGNHHQVTHFDKANLTVTEFTNRGLGLDYKSYYYRTQCSTTNNSLILYQTV